MSLHANLSPEALEMLKAQKKKSTVFSLVIAFLLITLVLLVLGFLLLPSLVKETPTIVTYEASVKEEQELQEKKVNTSMDRTPSSPSSSMAKVITANTSSPTAVPVPDVDVTTPSVTFGNGDDFGNGWGSGDGTGNGGGGFGGIPSSMKKRCSKQDRLARLQESGGTPQCEEAVVKALDWMKANQSADGSWTGTNQAAMTGLALLAYLGHCETPVSERYGDTVLRAITYLVNLGMKNDGKLCTVPSGNHFPYEHGIATYALAEASIFCKQGNINIPYLFEVTQKAGQFIIQNQNQNGGWAYNYDVSTAGHTDLSVVGWQIQALKACNHTGLKFDGMSRCISKGLDFVSGCQDSSGAFGYTGPGQGARDGYFPLTGVGVLCLQMWDKGSTSSTRKGVKYIDDNTKFDYKGQSGDLYCHYYQAQAMMNRGGNEWKKYNDLFRDQLLKNQNPDGSWPSPGGGLAMNPHYQTCLATLMLEVYYRFLPGTGGK
jgi:hypothetical protein